jgi:hypothetical protein
VAKDAVEGYILAPDGRPFSEPVAVYLIQGSRSQAAGITFERDKSRILSQGRLFFRSVLTDSTGFFSFSGLAKNSSYMVLPRLNTYTFEPAERPIRSGQVTVYFKVQPVSLNAPMCSRKNEASHVTKADDKALDLQSYVLKTISSLTTTVRREVRDKKKRATAERAFAAAKASGEFAYFEVMNESYEIPKVTLTCSNVPSRCARQSYVASVTNYRKHLRTLLQAGVSANRAAAAALGRGHWAEDVISRRLTQLHRSAMQDTVDMPTRTVECP